MPFKYIAGIVAATLVVVYTGAIAWKLKDVALALLILVGIAMMAADLWQSFKSDPD